MNDFTKQELQTIHLDVNTYINKYNGILKPSPYHLALRDKIESMIDNYCEHEETGNDYPGVLCFKCRRMWE